MSSNRRSKTLIALVLAAGAIAPTTGARAQTDNHGSPNAVPPILRPAHPAELAAIRQDEARKRASFYYRLPADASYSNAEMDAFAIEGYAA